MPLVIVSGYPSSGKSTRAQELSELIKQRINAPDYKGPSDLQVKIINDEFLGISKDVYGNPIEEKKARGALMSAVERYTSRNTIVIADAMNYIKGFRYQLYCIARSIGTPHCVLYCAILGEKAKAINDNRNDGYPSQIFNELIMRYEEPNGFNRWDSPLFTLAQHLEDEKLPFEQIWEALIEKKAPPPNLSTAVKQASSTNFLYELDQITKDIIDQIFASQKSGILVDELAVSRANKKISMPTRNITLSELKRYRNQFIKINRMHKISIEAMADLFVDYLNTNF